MTRFSVFFAFFSVICSTLFCNSEVTSNCGTFVKSTCNDHVTSKWNKHNVAHHLKSWFTQIEKLTSLKQAEQKHFFSEKAILQDPKTNIVRYIGNVDCLSRSTLGPVWKTAGKISNHQFHDGFLYGHGDKNLTLTGTWVTINVQKMWLCIRLFLKAI